MVEKPNTVMIYLVIAILMASWPFLVVLFREKLNSVLGRIDLAVLMAGRSPFFYHVTGGCVGILAGSTLLWWKTGDQRMSPLDIGTSLGVAGLALALLGWRGGRTYESKLVQRVAIGLTIILALYLSFASGILQRPFVALTAWHHWSAYIGPSELMSAGGRIFYDFPSQYGAGPTALIAASCFGSCWIGMYYVTAVATFLFFLITLYCALFSPAQAAGGKVIVVIGAIAVCFFWSAYPPLVSTPRMVPSVQGLRFLPAFILVFAQLIVEQTPRLSRHWASCGHACYALGVLWSPEAFFMVGFIWAPYFCLRKFSEASAASRLKSLAKSIGTIGFLTATIAFGFVSVYWTTYGVAPSFGAYLIYIMYPPGPLPVDRLGPIWFSAISVFIGAVVFTRSLLAYGDVREHRHQMLFLFLAYAALIYCMGRGHSNNFLNVLPAIFLVLLCGIDPRAPLAFRSCATAMLVCLIAFLNMFGWTEWNSTVAEGKAFQFDPKSAISLWTYDNEDIAAELKHVFGTEGGIENFASLSSALSDIKKISAEPISVINQYYLLPTDRSEPWNAFNGNGNYVFMPQEWRDDFLLKTSVSTPKDGWLIVEKGYPSDWLTSLDRFYKRGEQKDYGQYEAIHYTVLKNEGE